MINQIRKNDITTITKSQSFTYSKSSSNNIGLRDKSKSFNCYQGINYRRIEIIDNPFLKDAAEIGGAKAIVEWALCYKNGIRIVQNKEKAFKLFLWAALKNNVEAMYNLAICYRDSIGVIPNKTEAVKLFIQAAQMGHVSAANSLGCCYYNGEGVIEDKENAFKYFMQAAEKNYVQAIYNLGICYYNGAGVIEDKEKAFKYFMHAAIKGNSHAICCVGLSYYNGAGVTKDKEEAFKWFMQAAEKNHKKAFSYLIECYYYGDGVLKNKLEAFKWCQKGLILDIDNKEINVFNEKLLNFTKPDNLEIETYIRYGYAIQYEQLDEEIKNYNKRCPIGLEKFKKDSYILKTLLHKGVIRCFALKNIIDWCKVNQSNPISKGPIVFMKN